MSSDVKTIFDPAEMESVGEKLGYGKDSKERLPWEHYLSQYQEADPKEIAEEIGDSGAGALKMYVVESVNNFLAPMRERRAELAKDMDYVRDVLAEGNKKANAIANETLEQVRDAMGMRY